MYLYKKHLQKQVNTSKCVYFRWTVPLRDICKVWHREVDSLAKRSGNTLTFHSFICWNQSSGQCGSTTCSYASRHLLVICLAGKWFLINIAHQFISSVCVWTGKLVWWMQCGNALQFLCLRASCLGKILRETNSWENSKQWALLSTGQFINLFIWQKLCLKNNEIERK